MKVFSERQKNPNRNNGFRKKKERQSVLFYILLLCVKQPRSNLVGLPPTWLIVTGAVPFRWIMLEQDCNKYTIVNGIP
jgi:hypothetical protein